MSDVSADLRIFPDKEMFSVDMAEALDAAILRSGVIQGCTISITNGALSITNGRIVVGGRMGVITGGSVPIPTLSTQQTCTVVAVCDLRTAENPFYISIVDANGLQTLNSAKSSGDGFNVEGTLNYVVLGTVTVNPTTGLVSDWVASAGATAMKGPDIREDMRKDFLKDYLIRMSFNTGAHSPEAGTGTITYTYTIPEDQRPAGYKALEVRLATNGGGSNWYDFYNCACDFADSPANTTVNLRFQRRSGTGGTLYPWITVLYVKNIT